MSLILDASENVGSSNFKVLSLWAPGLSDGMPTKEDGMFSLVTLGRSEAVENIPMGGFQRQTFAEQLSNMDYRGGKGDISDGLRMLRDEVFAPSGES